jgi:hypothetical protein
MCTILLAVMFNSRIFEIKTETVDLDSVNTEYDMFT